MFVISDAFEVRDNAVHAEHTVSDDHDMAGTIGTGHFQLHFQIGHVVVRITVAHGLAQAHPVDDAGVVQGIADDGVLLPQ